MPDITIQQFKSMFNTNKKGDFKTSPEKTHGQLTLRKGKLVNVNRYDRGKTNGIETDPRAPVTKENYEIRMTLLNALKAAGVKEGSDFYVNTRKTLGLNDSNLGSGMARPLSRRTVKTILSAYQTAKKNQTLDSRIDVVQEASESSVGEMQGKADDVIGSSDDKATSDIEKEAVLVHYGFSDVRKDAMKAWDGKGYKNNYTIDAYNVGLGLNFVDIYNGVNGSPNEAINNFVAKLENTDNVQEVEVMEGESAIPKEEIVQWQAFLKEHAGRLNIVDRFKAYYEASKAATREGRTCGSGWASMIQKQGLYKTLQRVVLKNVPNITSEDAKDYANCLEKMILIETKDKDAETIAKERDEVLNTCGYEDGVNTNVFIHTMRYLFANSLFRQTSKLGLDFFAEKKRHIVFQMKDPTGKHVDDTELNDKWWKAGELETNPQLHPYAVPITYSEMRHLEQKNIAGKTTVTKEG